MTTINAIGGAGAMPTQHYAPTGGCGHHPTPKPPHLPPPPAPPIGMHALGGGTTRGIALAIVRLYDGDRNGVISAEEAVRVQRDHGGAIQLPGFADQTVDVFAMTKLFVTADADHDGRVGVSELSNVLERYDTGDTWSMKGRFPGQHLPIGVSDGRVAGSEFQRFMSQLGEQHVGSWRDRPRFPVFPMPFPGAAAQAPAAPGGRATPATQVATTAEPAAE